MSAIYDYETGHEIAVGLQGSKVCDEAIQTAQSCADDLGRAVELVDDDGRWAVHPSVDGHRAAADFLGEVDGEDDE